MTLTGLSTWFRRQSVGRKLTTSVVVTTATLLLASSAVFVVYDFVTLRSRLVRDVTMLADILGTNSTAALTFGDAPAATETLRAMALNPHIQAARLFTREGRLLASYGRPNSAPAPPRAETAPATDAARAVFSPGTLLVVRTIAFDGEAVGRIEVESDTGEVSAMVARFAAIVAATLLVAVGLALALSRATARLIFTPIGRLIDVTRQVRDSGRYDVRVAAGDADEVGELIERFNDMLSDIQKRDLQLLRHQEELEHTVEARTAELKASNLELVAARDHAMEASRAKSEFLANMSHEIRTPLNGVIGMTDLVLDSTLSADQRDSLVTVRTSAGALLSILNDVLDFSKIEARQLSLEAVPFSPLASTAAALKPFVLRAQQKGLELICDIAPDVPAGVLGDPMRVQQVLTNLVGNALKFTAQGHVLVAVREDARAGGRTTLRYSVTDTGPGIPADKHEAIFEAFRQADGSTTRRYGGTGLGLTISSTLVALMGGRLWVESREGLGSTFHFTLAFDVVQASEDEASARPPVDAAIAGDKPITRPRAAVLLVEDNVVNQKVAVGLLTRRGHQVEVASTGLEALARLEHQTFDVVLMDLQMPEMGGIEATVALRERERHTGRRQRVVAMTAHAMNSDRERCLAAGMDGYLSKPIVPGLLFAAVEERAGEQTVVRRRE